VTWAIPNVALEIVPAPLVANTSGGPVIRGQGLDWLGPVRPVLVYLILSL
jgi:hypothetical protein